jgi:hypothetical protein
MVRSGWAIIPLTILLFAVRVDAQGRLQSVRDDVRSTSDSKSSPSSDDNDWDWNWGSSSDSSSSDDSNGDYSFVGLAVLSPFLAPMALLKDDHTLRLDFPAHPYANGYRGYQLLPVVHAEVYYDKDYKQVPRKDWAVRLAVENGNDFAGLNRFNGQLKVEHANRWGVATSWNYYHETLPNGRSDETVIGDVNLTYRFAQNEVASMYAGLGVRVLTDRHLTDCGFNFTYGGDWFPVRPLIVSASFDAGTLGGAGVLHGRASIGAIFRGCEFYAGYDILRIGSTNLQGPLVGVRLWF